jgi:hypothetical protein
MWRRTLVRLSNNDAEGATTMDDDLMCYTFLFGVE